MSVEGENSDLHLGYKSNMTLKVAFPSGTTPSVTITISASSTKLAMALGDTNMARRGGNIIYLRYGFYYIVLSSTKSSGFYTILGGNFTLENVDNSGSSTNYEDSVVDVETEAYVTSIDSITEGEQYVVRFTAYNNGVSIWNRDVTYTMRTAIMDPPKTPEVFVTFPDTSDLERGMMARISVDLWMPLPNPDIVVTVQSLQSELRVLRLSVSAVGDNFNFLMKLDKYVVKGVVCDETVTGNDTLELVFPTHLANLDAYSPTPVSSKDLIQLESLVYMDLTSLAGATFPLDFTIYVDNSVLWTKTFQFTSKAPVTIPVASNMKMLPNNKNVAVGRPFSMDLNLTFPEFGVFQINVTVKSVVRGKSGKAGVMMKDITVQLTGSNILCHSVKMHFSKTGQSKVQNVMVAVIGVTNLGSQLPSPNEDKNWLVLRASAIPVPGYTEIGDTNSMDISSGPRNVSEEVDVTSIETFDQNLVYVVDFYHKDSMACISENQTFEILVNITTERNKSPGSLFVQFPVDETPFSVHEYKIVHVGENLLPCFQSIQLDGSLDKFTVYNDGSLGNVTLEFPLFCNKEDPLRASTVLADQLTIRVVMGIRNDIQVEGSTAGFSVLVKSSGLLQNVLATLDIIIEKMTFFEKLSMVHGIEILKTDFDVTQFVSNCEVTYSKDSLNYQSTNLQFETENATHVVYNLEDRPLSTNIGLVPVSPNSTSCCVAHKFLVKNLEEGFEVFNDINGTITSNMISVFDSKNDTCVKLPVIGQTPPILWMRINTSMIWGLAPSAFQLTVIGQGISCNKHNNVTLLQVLFPISSPMIGFQGDMTYCQLSDDLVSHSNNDGPSRCTYQCPCVGPHCSEVLVFFATAYSNIEWNLCELFANNI
eukprot:XP_019920703.1 PREDICTED: uncharacterized protein LOC105323112 [Crassostrea gigas]